MWRLRRSLASFYRLLGLCVPSRCLAFGFDLFIVIMGGLDSIRDVIAFPKAHKGIRPLAGAPDYV